MRPPFQNPEGPSGTRDTKLLNPVYVGDCNHHISVFTSDSQFLTSFGRKGEVLGEFKYPHGLEVDVSGVVYVCDRDNSRIQSLCIYIVIMSLMSVHTCIILVSMYLHCYSELF